MNNMTEIHSYVSADIHSNTYLVVDKETMEAAVIDPSLSPTVFGVDLSLIKIKYILLTHGHFDHMFKLSEYTERYGASVCVHRLDGELLQDQRKNCSGLFMKNGLSWNKPDITFEDGQIFLLGDTEITVVHTPGHTEGSVCYLCGDAMFSGDTLFCGSVGRVDFFGGDTAMMRESLKKLKGLDKNYTVYSGHGNITTLDREKKYNSYMLYLEEQGDL